jgi:CubicO group peptidase (beta-lactamase class C family)
VPTLLDVLNGLGNSPRVELSQTPGIEHHYSGAGFVVLQRMLEQVTGQTLAQYMANEVFAPLGMTTSSYDLNPPYQLASGHVGGMVIPGRRNSYPESAAAGLYTNVLDLSALVGFLNRAFVAPGDIPGGPLTKASVTTMLNPGPTPTMGRGIFLTAPGTPNFQLLPHRFQPWVQVGVQRVSKPGHGIRDPGQRRRLLAGERHRRRHQGGLCPAGLTT